MMTSLILAAIAINVMIGYFIVSLFLEGIPSLSKLPLFKISLGVGVGIGVTSLLSFLWQAVITQFYFGYALLEICLLFVLFFLWQYSRKPQHSEAVVKESYSSGWTTFLLIIFSAEILIGLLTFILAIIQYPYGPWDAWRLWNRAARFLYAGGEYWKNGFSPFLHLPDYPILLGSSVARVWRYSGGESVLAPSLISLIFTLALVGLLISALVYLRGHVTGYLGGLLLFTASSLIVFTPAQWADIPIAFYFLSTIVLLHIHTCTAPSSKALPFLAGVTSALATWTKNEGWFFLVTSFCICFWVVPFLKKRSPEYKSIVSFVAGTLPVLLVVLYFKLILAPANYLIINQPEEFPLIDRMLDPWRYKMILQGYFIQFFDFTPDRSTPLIVLAVIVLVFGFKFHALQEINFLSSALIVLSLSIIYFIVYLATPYDLIWQVTTSFYRLSLQLWPIIVLETALLISPSLTAERVNT